MGGCVWVCVWGFVVVCVCVFGAHVCVFGVCLVCVWCMFGVNEISSI